MRGPVIAALARVVPGDITRAAEALAGAERWRIHTFISTSDIHITDMLRMSQGQVLDAIREGVKLAVGYTEDVEFSAQDATRTELDFLLECFRVAVDAGATTINVPDTVGYAMPHEFGELVRTVREAVPEHVVISTHCHNDLGLAVANSLAGIVNGARQIEVAVNGIGERAGNCSLEEVAMIVRTRREALGVSHGLNLKEITRTSRLVSMTTGYGVQPNKAVVGSSAFAHESGIHQHGVLANRATAIIWRSPPKMGIRSMNESFARRPFSVRSQARNEPRAAPMRMPGTNARMNLSDDSRKRTSRTATPPPISRATSCCRVSRIS